MNESLGARLRQERESKQIPLASIAASTKIKLEWLEGLENDDVSKWPSGIFRRGFIRSYAQAIGLQPDPVTREFFALYPDPAELERAAVANGSGPRGRGVLGSLANRETAEKPPSGSTAWIADRLNAAIRSANAERPQVSTGERASPPAFADPSPMSEPRPQQEQPEQPAITVRDAEPPPDYQAAANLCTMLASVMETEEVFPLLEPLAELLNSTGVVVWLADRTGRSLVPALWWGYSITVITRLGSIRATAENATAAAFRTGQPQVVGADQSVCAAIAVPLMTPNGCAGVLAAEVRPGSEQKDWICGFARIFAAQLAMLVAVPECEAHAVGA